MENASKALVMAGGVLIGVMVLSLAVYLFVDFGSTSAEINAQNAQKQITQFNSKFTSYADKEVTIYDVITVANYAIENNKYYEEVDGYKITVMLDKSDLTNNIDKNTLMEQDKDMIDNTSPKLPVYECKSEEIEYYADGRVKKLTFRKI